MRQDVIGLPPVPKGAYAEVIRGRRDGWMARTALSRSRRSLVDALLADVESSGATDALPLLAFTLERLYDEYHVGGDLKLVHYNALGGVKGSIEAAVERALQAADGDRMVPKDHLARLASLRRGLIPWLAGIDPDTGAPRRRVARLSEIPAEARPLIQQFVEQRLLVTDLAKDNGERTIEPAHEALLRQWGLLRDWLSEDAELLTVMDGVKRASRDWVASGKDPAWLAHETGRLETAQRLLERVDLAASLRPTDRDYIAACKRKEVAAKSLRRRVQALIGVMLLGIIAGLIGWINQSYLIERINWFTTMRPYMLTSVRPYVLTSEAARALVPLQSFRECAKDCPEMIVVPAGSFIDGVAAKRTRPFFQRRPAAQGQHLATIRCLQVQRDFCGMGRMRLRWRMFPRPRCWIRARHEARRQCDLARSPAVCCVVLEDDRSTVPSAVGSRMGIRGARWHDPLLTLGATKSAKETPIAMDAAANGTTGRRHRSDPSSQMRSASTTCMETSGSGSMTATSTIIARRRLTDQRARPETAVVASFAAVLQILPRPAFALRPATETLRASGSTTSVSAWPER